MKYVIGGYLWKIPFGGHSAPVRRIVTIKREITKGPTSRKCQVYNAEGDYYAISDSEPSYIAWNPPALVIYYIKQTGAGKTKEKHIRQLLLEEGTLIIIIDCILS